VTDEPLADAWEAQAGEWRRWTRTPGLDRHFHQYNWPSFLALIPLPGRATLDLGCGEGRVGEVLHARGHRLTGVDLAPSMVRYARDSGAYAEVQHADAAALPLPDAAFDLVVAFMSLQDMDDAAAAVRETARVLEPGGRLVFAVVHPFASAALNHDDEQRVPYFEVERTADTIERAGVTITFHQIHRPLQDWFAMLRDAGYLVEEIREPRPSAADAAGDASLEKNRRRPVFLHVRAVKPAALPRTPRL
jgi:ubiquinone/menaquinone biosynthesis C-methylase UbiE